MDLTRIEAPDFDLAMTLNSGQVFHWEKIGDGFYGMIGDRAVYVEQRGDILKVRFGERNQQARRARDPRSSRVISRSIIRSRKSARRCRATRSWMRRAIFVAAFGLFDSHNGNAWPPLSVLR
jgi:hypothetical protein